MRSSAKNRRSVIWATAMVAGLGLASEANAAAYTWVPTSNNGADKSHWNQKKNWSPNNAYPSGSGDTAIFTGTAPTTIINLAVGPIGTVSVTGGSYNISGLNTNTLNINGGGLSGGTYTVNTDYVDSGWASETGNTFSPKLHTSGTTINAGGTSSLLVTLPDLSTLSGGGTGTLDFGTIAPGTTLTFTFDHVQASGLTIREALQTPNFGGVISILHGATPINDLNGELMTLSTSATETYTLVANAVGSVSGNLVFRSNFDNASLAPITISVSGMVSEPLPEPAALAMLATAGMLLVRRRSR